MADVKDKKLQDLSLRELRDKGMKTLSQMQDVYREKREGKEVTKEKETEFESWDKELVAIEQEIRFKEKQDLFEMEESRKAPKVTDVDVDQDAFDSKFKPSEKEVRATTAKISKRGFNALNAHEKKIANLLEIEERAFVQALKTGFDPARMDSETRGILDAREQRAQSVTTTGGGYLIPEGFIKDTIVAMKEISPFFAERSASPTGVAQSLFNFRRTSGGGPIPWPTLDDTANVGELLAINTTIGSATDLTFARKVLTSFKYSSKPILLPYELIEDDGVGVGELVTSSLATRIARIANTHLTTGDDSGKPQGIVIGATSGKVTAAATSTTFLEILDLVHSVDPAYRKSPSCRFMFHDNILLYLKKLTIGSSTNDARPVWNSGFATGAPPTIDGFQYVINQDMASSVATNSKIMLFGDMKQYAVRMVNDVRAYKLEERYRDIDQTGFISFVRLDGRILNSAAIKYMRTT